MRTSGMFSKIFVPTALALACLGARAEVGTLQYLGQQIIASGTVYNGTTIGGLSGIDYNASTSRFLAISDDRSGLNPARFYGLQLDLNQFVRSSNPGSAGVTFQSVTTIARPDGSAFPTNQVDPESLRINPANGRLLWSNEGQRAAAGLQRPDGARDGCRRQLHPRIQRTGTL